MTKNNITYNIVVLKRNNTGVDAVICILGGIKEEYRNEVKTTPIDEDTLYFQDVDNKVIQIREIVLVNGKIIKCNL